MRRMNVLDWIAFALVIIGGINWGLLGLLEVNVVADIFGHPSAFTRFIYILVGLASLYLLYVVIATSARKTP